MRPIVRYLVASAAVTTLAACGEAPTAPATLATPASHIAPAAGPVFDFSGNGSRSFGDQSSDFTVTSRGGSFSVNGLFTVNFPENSVCSPDRSSYGPSEWDKSCSTLRSNESVRITARLRLTTGGMVVDFSPALRFSPIAQVILTSDIFSSVITTNRSYFSGNHDALAFLAVGYSSALGGSVAADYKADPTLVTHVSLSTGTVWRRVKHFSGYAMGSGDACTPSPDVPDCVRVDR